MKNFFRPMDEMEFSISLRAIKIAWIYSVLVLFIRMIYDFAVTGSVIGFCFLPANYPKCTVQHGTNLFKMEAW